MKKLWQTGIDLIIVFSPVGLYIKMKKQYHLKSTYLIQDHLLSLPLKMSKNLHSLKVLFHKKVSQTPSQRYGFENNNRRNLNNNGG